MNLVNSYTVMTLVPGAEGTEAKWEAKHGSTISLDEMFAAAREALAGAPMVRVKVNLCTPDAPTAFIKHMVSYYLTRQAWLRGNLDYHDEAMEAALRDRYAKIAKIP